MNKIKKSLTVLTLSAVSVCALAGNVSAAKYGDNVITADEVAKYDASAVCEYDANSDGYFDILDLVRVKKAAAGEAVDINYEALKIADGAEIDAAVITPLKQALLSK